MLSGLTRRLLYNKPKKSDHCLLAQFYHADVDLCNVAAELDSFDGRKNPSRCAALVAKLRQYQDHVLRLIQLMMDEVIPDQRASRDFRIKYPEDLIQEGLAGQLWFGAECLAAGSSILNREVESESMRPMARSLTKQLDMLRQTLRDQSTRDPLSYPDRIKAAFVRFDHTFAEFELSYVSAMVPVKTMKEYDMSQEVAVLFSETVHRALAHGLITGDMLEYYDPLLMFTIPRLAIVSGLVFFHQGPLNPERKSQNMSEMFRPFQSLLKRIRELLWTLTQDELRHLERLLCNLEEALPNDQSSADHTHSSADHAHSSADHAHSSTHHLSHKSSDAVAGKLPSPAAPTSLFNDISSVNDSESTSSSQSTGAQLTTAHLDLRTSLLNVLDSEALDRENSNLPEDSPDSQNNNGAAAEPPDPRPPIADQQSASTSTEIINDAVSGVAKLIIHPSSSNQREARFADGATTSTDINCRSRNRVRRQQSAGSDTSRFVFNLPDSYHVARSADASYRSTDAINRSDDVVSRSEEEVVNSPHSSAETYRGSDRDALNVSDDISIDISDHEAINSTEQDTVTIADHEAINSAEHATIEPSRITMSRSMSHEGPDTGVVTQERGRDSSPYDIDSDSTMSSLSSHEDYDSSSSSADEQHESLQAERDRLVLKAMLNEKTESLRRQFKNTEELLQKLFICISGVADQLQSNFACDLRNILKCVFELHTGGTEYVSNPDKNRSPTIADAAVLQSPPTWIPDAEMDKCCSCKLPFTVLRRRHHCRNCGLIFCGRCSSNTAPLPNYGYETAVRICNKCYIYHVNPFFMDNGDEESYNSLTSRRQP